MYIDSYKSTGNVPDNANALAIRPTPQRIYRTTFAKVITNGVDSTYFTQIGSTGSGQTINQTAGNLVFTTGTTANTETIVRSTESFSNALTARVKTILSQRIANQNFFVELVDVLGDSLAITISSATAVTVTFPTGHGFTSQNVGQSMYLGAYSGTGTFIPGRYAIASVSGDNVTFTVAGFVAGSGTCSAFGWNYYQLTYTGVTETSVNYDAQRNGWASGVTAATISTTASPGHVAVINAENGIGTLSDMLVASSTTLQETKRANRVENVPGNEINLYLQIRVVNGSTAPASNTTWTIGFASVEDYVPVQTSVTSARSQSFNSALPVSVNNTPAMTLTSGTVTTVSTVTTNNNNIPDLIADVASAAITTTTTTAALTPTSGSSYQVVIPVTVVSGTTPTLTVGIEESDDSGTNWYNRYTFPVITATGIYRSPILKLRGNRVRYVQTITGTTPSFTRAISRLQRQDVAVSGVSGKLISAATTNATSVKPTPCEITMLNASNSNAAARFLKIYDKASAPTVGTDTPIATYLIPGNSSGTNIPITVPINFSLGFALAITGAVTDADTTAIGANDVVVNYNVA